jgi:hypothetical protein
MEIAPDAALATYGTDFDYENIMRWFGSTLSVLAITLAGCASQQASVAPVQQIPTYTEVDASALAFDPPVLAGTPRIDLSRDGRGTAAFAGFDEGSTTYYYLRTDDLYSDFANGGGGRGINPDNYQRRAVSETYGISYH